MEEKNPGRCEVCGDLVFFVRRVEGWTIHPVLPDGTVNMEVELERFDGRVWENFRCIAEDEKKIHDLPPRQIRSLRRLYEEQYEALMDEVKSLTGAEEITVDDFVDPFRWLQIGIRGNHPED